MKGTYPRAKFSIGLWPELQIDAVRQPSWRLIEVTG